MQKKVTLGFDNSTWSHFFDYSFSKVLLIWTILKSFFEFVTILLMFYGLFFFFFGLKAHKILAPQLGIEPAPPALEGKILTTGPLGKSLETF